MKKQHVWIWLTAIAVVFGTIAADLEFVTIRPQIDAYGNRESTVNLQYRTGRGIADLQEAIVGKGTNILQTVATFSGSISIGNVGVTNSVGLANTNDLAVHVTSMPTNQVTIGTIVNITDAVTNTIPPGCSTVGLQISGTWVGQIDFQGTVDGTTWTALAAYNGYSTINATAGNGVFILPGGGYQKIRAYCTAKTGADVVTCTFNSTIGPTASVLTGSLPQGANYIGQVGTTNVTTTAALVFTNIVNTDPAVPVVLGVSGWTFKAITFAGYKAVRTANVGDVFILNAAANDGVGMRVTSEAERKIEAAPGTVLNASQFYLDVVTAADGVIIRTYN